MQVEIHYRDKKHSSGVIRGGKIVLYISARLSAAEAQRHIEHLRRTLEQKAIAPDRAPLDLPPGDVVTDAELAALAQRLNAQHYGFRYESIRFKRQRWRWGSCNPALRRMYISDRLRGAPMPLLEYVVVHELCHLRYGTHGPRFWKLVERGCPDYRERRAMLQRWGARWE